MKYSPYEYSYWKDELYGYNNEICITNNERRMFIRAMIKRNILGSD